MAKKQLLTTLFDMNCVSHMTHGLWRHPRNNRHRFNDLSYWLELAQLLEEGCFDALFLADTAGIYDEFRNSMASSVKEAMQLPVNDPALLVPAMAAVTEHLGFIVTTSVLADPPFSHARRMSTLDHLTKGRIAWNAVTSYLPNAARNYGWGEQLPPSAIRYATLEEYYQVCYKLWEGSWDDDAVVMNREAGVYADPAKVRYINHKGARFEVAGPHMCQPSVQRTPLLFHPVGSMNGVRAGGRHAEVIFAGSRDRAGLCQIITAVRNAARMEGRDPHQIKFVTQADIVVGRNEAEVRTKLGEFREFSSVEGKFAHGRPPVDYLAFDPQEILGTDADGTVIRAGDMLERWKDIPQGRYFVSGTPEAVADRIEEWMDVDGLDGIQLNQWLSHETARDFIELVVPELRRRGRYREAYVPGETLRERTFGAGYSRLPKNHPGGRYRNNPDALK